jgi:hypothetical protein
LAAYLKPALTVAVWLTFAAPAAGWPLDPLSSRLLAAQNAERARVGVPPLDWDPALASSAASYGPVLAGLGRLQHSPRDTRPGQRENLWMGTRGAFSPEQMVATWTGERRFFRPGIYPDVSTTGNWMDVSHYTALIWRTTTRVGCAIHRTPDWEFLICRYSPPGNIGGRAVP